MTGVECHQPDFPSLKPSTPPQLNVDTKSNVLEDVSPFKLVFFGIYSLNFSPISTGSTYMFTMIFPAIFLRAKFWSKNSPTPPPVCTTTRLHVLFRFFCSKKRSSKTKVPSYGGNNRILECNLRFFPPKKVEKLEKNT